jgi:3-oxoacid CoA-transferase B subunit
MNSLRTDDIARRLAQDIPDGAYVNLGIGLPTMVANFVTPDKEVIYQSENGILGVGPAPAPGQENPELINASKKFVTLLRGGAFFDNAQSFGMMRGGHIDIAVLGAYQVSAGGDLANWATDDERYPPAVGGAMDLAVGAKQVFVLMRHTSRDNRPKILDACTYPLTGAGVVTRIYTDLAVIHVTARGLQVHELHPGNTFEEVQALTGAKLLAPA